MFQIRPATTEDMEACVAIVVALPDYFTPDVPDKIRRDWGRCRTWVAADEDRVLGMAMVERRFPRAAEILWAAVAPDHRFGGIGTALVHEVVESSAAEGVRVLEVKTLDSSAGYEPYVATVAFWEARGFVQIDTIDPFADWAPGNPAAIYVQPINP